MSSDLRYRLTERFADECPGVVVRDGIEDACGKPTTCMIDGRRSEEQDYWTACTYHAHRYGYGHVVPLSAIRAALLERQTP
jgi:hypothetical protein